MSVLDSLLPFSSLISSVFSALDARANRNFQERMSSTAHQREVRDMLAAGINPALSARSGGASTPGGAQARIEDIGSSAMAVRLNKAQVNLLEASALREVANARLANTQATDISNTAAAGRLRGITAQADISEMDARQRAVVLPLALDQAKAELQQRLSSARAADAVAALDEAARAGAENVEALERRLGEAGPAVRFFFELLRVMRAAKEIK